MGDPYFYLVQLHTTCVALSDLGLPNEAGAFNIRVAAFFLNLADEVLDLSKPDGMIATLLLWRLLPAPKGLGPAGAILIPPELSLPRWKGVRWKSFGYMPFIPFLPAFRPSNIKEGEENVHRVAIVDGLTIPVAKTLISMAMQRESLRGWSPMRRRNHPR